MHISPAHPHNYKVVQYQRSGSVKAVRMWLYLNSVCINISDGHAV
jgi:hypothetical protein